MEFTKSLLKGKLIKRYKRFFVDIRLNKKIVTQLLQNKMNSKHIIEEIIPLFD